MGRAKRTLLATAAAVAVLVGLQPAPASAATVGTATIAINVTTSRLGLFGVGSSTSGSSSASQTIACFDTVLGKTVTAGACAVSGSGTSAGSCGLASGTLWGTLTLSNGMNLTFHIQFQIAGPAIIATGSATVGGQTGVITLEGTFTPLPSIGGPSCLSQTQSEFLLAGTSTWVTT